MSGALEEALLAAPPVEATAPDPDAAFRARNLLPSSPAHDSEGIQRAIDRGRRQQRIRSTHSRLSSLREQESTSTPAALGAVGKSESTGWSGCRRKVLPSALAVTGAALQLLCWSAAYEFDLQLLKQKEFQRQYNVGSSLVDLAALALFQLVWVLGALCACRVRTRGFRLSIAMLLLASIAGILKVALLLTVAPINEGDGSGSGAETRATRQRDASLAMAVLAIIVPASEVVFLRRMRNSVISASSADYRRYGRGGSGFARVGRDGETFSVTDTLPERRHEEESSSDGEDRAGVATAEQQQRWLRGASLRASRDKKHSSLASASSNGLQTTDGDLSGSVGWGVGLDAEVEAEDGALEHAEAKLGAKLEGKRLRNSKSAEGGRDRSNSTSKSSSKRSKRSKDGDDRKRDKKRDDSGKLGRNSSRETAAAVAAARSATNRDSAEFLATPGRPQKERSNKRSGKIATAVALDTSIQVEGERKEPPIHGKTLPKEYATLVSAWAAGGMELQWQTSSGSTGNEDESKTSLAIGLPELRALVSAAFDAVTGTEGWETRSDEALRLVGSKHRTVLLTSTICLVERAVRSKSITTAAKQGSATAVLEERMLPVGFPRDFIGQLALCLEQCFENRRMQRKSKKTADNKSQRSKPLPESGGRRAPPPPPLEHPPSAPAPPALPTGLVATALEERSQRQDADTAAGGVVDHRTYGGIALPGFEHRAPGVRPGPFTPGSEADPHAAAGLSDSMSAKIESADGNSTRHSDLETARVLREQVRAY